MNGESVHGMELLHHAFQHVIDEVELLTQRALKQELGRVNPLPLREPRIRRVFQVGGGGNQEQLLVFWPHLSIVQRHNLSAAGDYLRRR
jgi:hypothetical protein